MRPTRRAVLLTAGALPVALLAALVATPLWTLWVAYLGLGFLAIGVDALLGLPARQLALAAHAPEMLYIGDPQHAPLALDLSTRHKLGADVEVRVELHDDLEPQPAQTLRVQSGRPARATVALAPKRRGEKPIAAAWLRWSGPLGLWRRQTRVALDTRVPVVPNTRAVRAAALRFFSSRDFLSGLKVERYLGDGSEFESLREYVPGMDHRAMDWKSSARHRKLLVQNFRAERDHQVVLAVDTGHLMAEPLEGVPRLDHAINSALLLAYFGLRTGDRVGLYGFDEKVRSWTEPQGGLAAFARLQAASTGLDYSRSETNFTLGLAELSTRLRRRSLVVVLTDFVDVVTAELMVENLDRLARRHLVVFVTLRDPSLGRIAAAPPHSQLALYRAVGAADLERERELVLRRLRRLGIATIDAAPEEVSLQLLNRYLDVKRREMI
jgi:uncharacterized protein (DUF58 family)